MPNEWQQFFDNHAPVYMENVFTKNTIAEVDFLLELFALPPGSSIFEIGCGTGRHSVELASRGYHVTGIDISAGMLAEARKAAVTAGVDIEFIQADAKTYRADRLYDAAICLCEGAFCLLGADDDPLERDLVILRNIHDAMKPGAPFLLTTLSAFRSIRNPQPSFDPLTLVETCEMTWETPEGAKQVTVRERHYVPTELALLCRLAGLTVEHIWGGTAGNWGRRPIDLDEFEMMVVARRGE